MELNWKKLYFGRVSPGEVQEAVNDPQWQAVRLSMKGESLEVKYNILSDYLTSQVPGARNAHDTCTRD